MLSHVVALRSLLLILIFSAAALPGFQKASRAATPAAADDVRVLYWVDDVFGSRYVSQVMITNMTRTPLEGWTMSFDLAPAATGVRGATLVSVSGATHNVQGSGWTGTIAPGEAAWFSIDGVLPSGATMDASGVPMPAACSFNGVACTFEEVVEPIEVPDTLGVDVGWWVATQGATQYTAQVLLKNITDQPITDWEMRFRSTSLITDIEHVAWTANGADYLVRGRGWTSRIEPDEYVWFTLRGVHTGAVDTLSSCIFEGFPCTFIDPLDFVEPEDPEEPPAPGGLCTIVSDGSETPNSNNVRIVFKWTALWGTGYNATINLVNSGEDALRDWELRFRIPTYMTITQLWNASWTRSGEQVTLTPLPWNTCLEPGQTLSFGFEGKHSGEVLPPSGCLLGGDDCEFSKRIVSTAVEPELTAPGANGHAYALAAPYPNPFAAEAWVPFHVAETQSVRLTLWDMQGRSRGVLFDGTAVAGEAYRIRIPADDLPAGLYLVRLSGVTGGVSRPVTLIR